MYNIDFIGTTLILGTPSEMQQINTYIGAVLSPDPLERGNYTVIR